MIIQTRIPQIEVKDRLAWTGSHKGVYSVKSGYRYWETRYASTDNMIESQGWNRLWKLQLPHKTRVFLWRFCRNIIPVRWILRSKGVETTVLCPMCGTDIEHLRHLFCECSFAAECWSISGFNINMQETELTSEWLLNLISKEIEETILSVTNVLSGIWFSRNKRVWEGRIITPAVTMEVSAKTMQEWREANKRKERSSIMHPETEDQDQIQCYDSAFPHPFVSREPNT